MKRLFLFLALTALAWPGDIEGTVEIRTPLARRPRGKLQRHPGSTGNLLYSERSRSNLAQGDEVPNVVLSLLDTPGGQTQPRTVSLSQSNRTFVPYILPIVQGSTVEFLNGDSIYHSVYSQSECKPFHLPEYPQGESRAISFPQVGVVELFCAIHPDMNAYVVVLEGGHFCQPDRLHQFRLSDVPAGRRILKAWHPRLPSQTKVIEVPTQGTVRVELTL